MKRRSIHVFSYMGLAILFMSLMIAPNVVNAQSSSPELTDLRFNKLSVTAGDTFKVQASFNNDSRISYADARVTPEYSADFYYGTFKWNSTSGYWEAEFNVTEYWSPSYFIVDYLYISEDDGGTAEYTTDDQILIEQAIEIYGTEGVYINDIRTNSTSVSPDFTTKIEVDLNQFESNVTSGYIDLGIPHYDNKFLYDNYVAYSDLTYNPSSGVLEALVNLNEFEVQSDRIEIMYIGITLDNGHSKNFDRWQINEVLPPIFSSTGVAQYELDHFSYNVTSATVGDAIGVKFNFTNVMDNISYINADLKQTSRPSGYASTSYYDPNTNLFTLEYVVGELWMEASAFINTFNIEFTDGTYTHHVNYQFESSSSVDIYNTKAVKIDEVAFNTTTAAPGDPIELRVNTTDNQNVTSAFAQLAEVYDSDKSLSIDDHSPSVYFFDYIELVNDGTGQYKGEFIIPDWLGGDIFLYSLGFSYDTYYQGDDYDIQNHYNGIHFIATNISNSGYNDPTGGESINIFVEPAYGSSSVGESVNFITYIESNFSHDMEAVDLEILVTGPNGYDEFIDVSDIFLPAHSHIEQEFTIEFPEEGEYSVEATLFDDIDNPWSFYFSWEVGTDDGSESDDEFTNSSSSEDLNASTPELNLPGFEIPTAMAAIMFTMIAIYRRRSIH